MRSWLWIKTGYRVFLGYFISAVAISLGSLLYIVYNVNEFIVNICYLSFGEFILLKFDRIFLL